MRLSPNAGRWAVRLVKLVVIVELAWLVVINALLHIPYTQTVINTIRPEKFHVSWETAWSPYPGRVYLSNASANGNSRSQIWQVDVDSVSGSVSLLPLIFKRARFHGLNGENITFRLRPRIQPDRDYGPVEAFFPVIEGREPTPAVTTPRKKKRPWQITLDDVHLGGVLDYWVYQLQGSSASSIEGGLNYQTVGGPLELEVVNMELDLGPHYLNGDYEVFRQGGISGALGFSPFRPRENKGLALLDFLALDADINIDANSLKFIQLFLLKVRAIHVDGSGKVNGHLRFKNGLVLEGTDIGVDARDLQLDFPAHQILGTGKVSLEKGTATGGQLDLGFQFQDLELTHNDDPRPVLAGNELLINVVTDGYLVPKPGQLDEITAVNVEVGQLTVPDLAVFQGYLPSDLPLSITGGEAALVASFQLRPSDAGGYIRLQSGDARARLDDQDMQADMEAIIELTGGRPEELSFDLSGSELIFNNVRVSGEDAGFNDEAWAATLRMLKADLIFLDPLQISAQARLNASDSRPLVAVFRNQKGWRPEFIARAMTVEGIEGMINLEVLGNRVEVPDSWVSSDKFEAGAKAVFAESGSDGVVYLRYKKIDAVLKFDNGERNVDLIGARKKYDGFETSY